MVAANRGDSDIFVNFVAIEQINIIYSPKYKAKW